MKKKIEFYKHNLSSEDKKECLNTLNSLFLTTGESVHLFEEKFASYFGVKYCVGVTSCTDALFLSLKCLGIKEGDEVITTPLSFISTANVIEHCGAKPVFVDVEEATGNIDAELITLAISKATKAIIVVHLYGQMCDMRKIRQVADKYKLFLIEDCAHCIEGERDGVKPGMLGDLACFSFYATKNITSGEGGAIVCNNNKWYEWLKKARLHGMSKNASDRYSKYEHYDMEFLGYKANMNNIQASLLLHQLDRIEEYWRQKEQIAWEYDEGFKNNPNISLIENLSNTKHARHLYTIMVDPKKRDSYVSKFQAVGIGIAVNFKPIHLMSYYRTKYDYKQGDFKKAEKIGSSTISLPFYPKLKREEMRYVIRMVNEFLS